MTEYLIEVVISKKAVDNNGCKYEPMMENKAVFDTRSLRVSDAVALINEALNKIDPNGGDAWDSL